MYLQFQLETAYLHGDQSKGNKFEDYGEYVQVNEADKIAKIFPLLQCFNDLQKLRKQLVDFQSAMAIVIKRGY